MAANIQFADYAASVILGPLGPATTSIQLPAGQGALFPAAGAGPYFYATLVDIATGGLNQHEVVKVTARAGDLLTVARGGIIDGTPQSWPAGSGIELRDCAQAMTDVANLVSGGAPLTSTYILQAADASLPNRRILTGSASINVADGGATNPITLSVPANAVTNALLAQMPTNTLKGNNTGGLANALDLTVAQVVAMLGVVTAGGGVVSISAGTHAARPAFGTLGRVYIETDTLGIFYDTGAAWALIVPAFTGDVTNVAGSLAMTIAALAVTSGKIANGAVGSTQLAAGAVDNTKLAAMNAFTMKGNNTNAGAAPTDMTVTQIQALTGLDLFNVKSPQYGAIGDGIADDTAAINAAYTAIPAGGGILYFPAGTYKVTAALTAWNKALTVMGDGWNASTIATNSSTLDVVTVTAGLRITNMRFVPSVARTGGREIAVTAGSQIVIDNCLFLGYFIAIAAVGSVGQFTVDTCIFRNGTAATGIGIDVNTNGAANNVLNILMDAPAGSQPLAGIRIVQTQDLGLTNCDIIHHGNDLMIVPSTGLVVGSVYAEDCFFDTAVMGLLIQPTGSGAVLRCAFSNCWFSSHSAQGIHIIGGGSTNVNGIDFTNTQCFLNGSNGVQVDAGALNVRFLGGEFGQNTGDGLQFNTTDFAVIGVRSGTAAGFTGNTGYGVNVNVNAADRFVVTANDLTGNTLGALNNASTQVNWITGQNIADIGKFTVRGNLLTADLSNATTNSRTVWQSQTVNGFTAVGIKPNGTSQQAFLQLYNNSDLTAPMAFTDLRIGTIAATITSGNLNGGTTLPLQFNCNGINAKLTVAGLWLFGPTLPIDDGVSAVQINGSLNIASGANLLKADFTSAATARTLVQTNQGPNNNTIVTAIPLGTGSTAAWQVTNNSNVAGAFSFGDVRIGAAAVQLFSGQSGGGTILPIRMVFNAVTATEWSISGDLQHKFAIADQGYSLQVPITGFTITIPDHCSGLFLNPAGVLATGTVTMPANPVDGQLVRLATTQTITALTLNANAGQTISGNVTTLTATAPASYMYILSLTKWIKVGS